MTDELKQAQQKAAQAAQAAEQAQRVADAAEIQFLDSVTHLKQISDNRTKRESDRLKSRYISTFGLKRWSDLCRDSR